MTHARRTLLAICATVATASAGLWTNAPAGATTLAAVPGGAARVVVHTARATNGIDLHLTDAAAITGRVSDPSSEQPLAGVLVTARDALGTQVGSSSTTRFDGRYTILGLPRSTTGVAVCVMPTAPSGGPTFGYAGRCSGTDELFLGTVPPPHATYLPTAPGTTRTGVDLVTGPRAALRVRVDAAGVAPSTLRSVTVRAYTTSGRLVAARAGHGGSTPIVVPVPAAGYRVCVDARSSAADAGLAGRCAGSLVAWVPGRPVPGAARTVTTAAGAATDVHVALFRGGAVTGTVRTTGGHVVTAARVVAYRSGVAWADTTSALGGAYEVRGLPSGRYRVCSSGGQRVGFGTVYAGGCTIATVRAKHATTGVDVRRAPVRHSIGSITGTVLDRAGRALSDVRVDAFGAGGRLVATTTTTTRGSYVLAGVAATATGYRVCFSGLSAAPASGVTRPHTGYASQCWSGVRWSRGPVPTGRTTLVPVAAGGIHRHVDATLQPGGLVRGQVTYHGVPLAGSRVYVADSRRTVVAVTSTDAHGRYRVTDLTPSLAGYYVCALGGSTGSPSTSGALGYRGRCSGDVAWDTQLR